MTTTWAGVHPGDTVQGADGSIWTVIGRERGPMWVGTGIRNDMFTMTSPGRRVVKAARALSEVAPLMARIDHTPESDAVDILIAAGMTIELLGETMPDPFTTPTPSNGKPVGTDGVKRDRWGRYLLPHPETGVEQAWTRASTLARTLADEYNLTLWKLRTAVKGISLRPDLIAAAAALDPDGDKGALNEIAEKAMERAGSDTGRNLGTALHAFAHRINRGETLMSMGVPAPLDRDLAAYLDALREHGLGVRPELCERIVVCPELGVAGTFDNIVTQPPGKAKVPPMSVLDLKTAKDIEYGWLEVSIQEAVYARSSHMWDPVTGTYTPLPGPHVLDRDRGLVLHLPVGKARATLYAVDLIKGWAYAQMAAKVRAARSGAKDLGWLVEPDPADLALHNVKRAADRAELARLWDQLNPKGLWTEEVGAAAQARMQYLETASPR